MTFKIGQELYRAWADDEGKCQCDVWVVRTIKAGKITAIERNEWTWVRNPDKFGGPRVWAKSIGKHERRSWMDYQPCPLNVTKELAWKQCLEDELRYFSPSDLDECLRMDKVKATCTRMAAQSRKK